MWSLDLHGCSHVAVYFVLVLYLGITSEDGEVLFKIQEGHIIIAIISPLSDFCSRDCVVDKGRFYAGKAKLQVRVNVTRVASHMVAGQSVPLGHTDIAHVQVAMLESNSIFTFGQGEDDAPKHIPDGPDVCDFNVLKICSSI